ncbi:hypothetical protein GCM10009854_06700 [Saccharopolyspora halophila]|uniref:Tat pathway signal protein n=1 Tax=Saccharopolyspora halophila TaxID=405551 RepID=A0ABN3FNU0_9PSEU
MTTEKPVADNEPEGDNNAEEPRQQVPESDEGKGRIRYQDPDSTTPREPTLAERRARKSAEQRRLDEERAAQEAEAAKTAKRRKALIGGGATVGVVALVAAMYSASEVSASANAQTQYCAAVEEGAQQPGPRAEDEKCDPEYVESQGGYVSGGMMFMPLFMGGPMVPQYRYAYTPSGASAPPVGSTATGSTFNKPSGSTIKSTSGSTIQRGGFGISSKTGGSGS